MSKRKHNHGSDGPSAGAAARDRALAAAASTEEDIPPYQQEWNRRRAAYDARILEYARQATEMVMDVLGTDIQLSPEDWVVVECAPGNTDSGDGIARTWGRVTIDGIRLHAWAEGWGVPPEASPLTTGNHSPSRGSADNWPS